MPQNGQQKIAEARKHGLCRLEVAGGIALDVAGTIAGAIPGEGALLVASQVVFSVAGAANSSRTNNNQGVIVGATGVGLTFTGLFSGSARVIPGVSAVLGAFQTYSDIKTAKEDYNKCVGE